MDDESVMQDFLETLIRHLDDETLFMLDALSPVDKDILMNLVADKIKDPLTNIETYQQIVDIIKDKLNKV